MAGGTEIIVLSSHTRNMDLYPSSSHCTLSLPQELRKVLFVEFCKCRVPLPEPMIPQLVIKPDNGSTFLAQRSQWSMRTRENYARLHPNVILRIPPSRADRTGNRQTQTSNVVHAYNAAPILYASGQGGGRSKKLGMNAVTGAQRGGQRGSSGAIDDSFDSRYLWNIPIPEHPTPSESVTVEITGDSNRVYSEVDNAQVQDVEFQLVTSPWTECGDLMSDTRVYPLPDEIDMNWASAAYPSQEILQVNGVSVRIPSINYVNYPRFFEVLTSTVASLVPSSSVVFSFIWPTMTSPSGVRITNNHATNSVSLNANAGTRIGRIFHAYSITVGPSASLDHFHLPLVHSHRFNVEITLKIHYRD